MKENTILLKDLLKVDLGEQKINDALNNLVGAVIDSKSEDIEKYTDVQFKTVSNFNDDIKVAIAATPIGRLAPLKPKFIEPNLVEKISSLKDSLEKDKQQSQSVGYVNTSKSSNEEIDEELNDEILRQLQLKESTQSQDQDHPVVEAIKLLYETHPECVNIDFEELSKVKDLHPDLQLLFKDKLKWNVVIHNTFNIREDILVELLRNMSEQDISFISSIHNISDEFITAHPELLDWNALLTFNRVPSEKVLFECFRYIPWGYKSTAYKQLICKQIFESSRPTDEE